MRLFVGKIGWVIRRPERQGEEEKQVTSAREKGENTLMWMEYEFFATKLIYIVVELHKGFAHGNTNDVKNAEKLQKSVIKANSPLKKKGDGDIIS